MRKIKVTNNNRGLFKDGFYRFFNEETVFAPRKHWTSQDKVSAGMQVAAAKSKRARKALRLEKSCAQRSS